MNWSARKGKQRLNGPPDRILRYIKTTFFLQTFHKKLIDVQIRLEIFQQVVASSNHVEATTGALFIMLEFSIENNRLLLIHLGIYRCEGCNPRLVCGEAELQVRSVLVYLCRLSTMSK